MDTVQFWSIIESGGRRALDDPDRQLEAVRKKLTRLSPDELAAFHHEFNRLMRDACTWDLWGAAYLINGGCSDDGFAYFRSWLISRGRSVFEAAVRDPDTLAGLVDPDRDDYEFEELWGSAPDLYEERVGEYPPPGDLSPDGPSGTRWDFDDQEQVAHRLPKLAALYD